MFFRKGTAQLRLWARMIVANTHDDLDHPPKVPMITGCVQRHPHKESLSDAFTSAASAIAKAFSPMQNTPLSTQVKCSPSKTVDIRMNNLEQLRCLQRVREDGILTEEEFLLQKNIVLQSLSKLVRQTSVCKSTGFSIQGLLRSQVFKAIYFN